MRHYFSIDGYFADSPDEPFNNYIVVDNDEIIEEEDDFIFFYGLSENEIKEAIEKQILVSQEFYITSYMEVDAP